MKKDKGQRGKASGGESRVACHNKSQRRHREDARAGAGANRLKGTPVRRGAERAGTVQGSGGEERAWLRRPHGYSHQGWRVHLLLSQT